MSLYLEAREVKKVYHQGSIAVIAVEAVSLTVEQGQIALISGPSGSGKTTLLSMLGCILRPTSGTVYVNGMIVSGLPESRLPEIRRASFGFVYQAFNLFPFLTALENVELAMRLQRIPARIRKARALDLLVQCGLAERTTFYPRDLSGGEKQRVAFARALAGDPLILLADEPTANLDSVNGEEVFGMLRRFAKDMRKIVVMVSHDPIAERFADHLFTLTDGHLQSLSCRATSVA